MSSLSFLKVRDAMYTLISIIVICTAANGQSNVDYEISAVKIVNYNQYEPIFKDVSEEKDYEYWNALGTSVVVSIVVEGERKNREAYVAGRKVEVNVYSGSKLITNRTGDVSYLRAGKFYLPIMLYGPFCKPLTIKARIIGQRKSSTISKTLNFACGE